MILLWSFDQQIFFLLYLCLGTLNARITEQVSEVYGRVSPRRLGGRRGLGTPYFINLWVLEWLLSLKLLILISLHVVLCLLIPIVGGLVLSFTV